jgi:hypothetical protein
MSLIKQFFVPPLVSNPWEKRTQLGGAAMSNDLTYYGYRIVSDVREVPGTRTWMGKAAVVQPADAFGIERVHPIFADACFITEKAASDYLIAEAKK